MTDSKNVLVIGLDPALIDFSKPGYPPGMTAEKVLAGIKSCEDELAGLGYNAQTCMHDFGETAETVVLEHLKQKQWDCVMIGAASERTPAISFCLRS
jgi:hypothetical protein